MQNAIVNGYRHDGHFSDDGAYFSSACGHTFSKKRLEAKEKYRGDCPDCKFDEVFKEQIVRKDV